ncbi:MAG: NADH-quinone oxidoreductase subunit NuoE [Planctomycetota bacterium]|nr:NADH-quinone oxidoreductase subunit NuoE [Planctomycetota bacterium]
MAWTVKPSATMKIPQRDEPYLTAEMRAHFEGELIPRYEQKRGALLPILHEVQHAYGYIPHQAMEEIASLLEIAPADVLDTASFYEEYHLEPVGKYVIAVCQSIACEVCGHQAIVDHLRQKLDIEPHETTDDGKFTLLTLECLGACDGAPCALVNDDRHDHLTIEKLDEILDGLPD